MRNAQERVSSVEVDRGLYAVKYVGPASASAPAAFVRASRATSHLVRIMSAPGAEDRSIWPGSALVLYAEGRATIEIVVRATSGDFESKFELDHLDKGKIEPLFETNLDAGDVAPTPTMFVAADPIAARGSLAVTAHVAHLGDVRVGNGAWIAGPGHPAHIEGFAVQGQALEYQALVAGETRWSDWVVDGSFVGTKARYLPLIGVRFRLSSKSPQGASLRACGLFLGSSIQEKTGREIELRSAAGIDPLIGLMVDLHLTPREAEKMPLVPAKEGRGRVRVFKASDIASTFDGIGL